MYVCVCAHTRSSLGERSSRPTVTVTREYISNFNRKPRSRISRHCVGRLVGLETFTKARVRCVCARASVLKQSVARARRGVNTLIRCSNGFQVIGRGEGTGVICFPNTAHPRRSCDRNEGNRRLATLLRPVLVDATIFPRESDVK